MQLVTGGERAAGRERHALDPRQQALQCCGALTAPRLVQRLHNHAHALRFLEDQFTDGPQHAPAINRFRAPGYLKTAPTCSGWSSWSWRSKGERRGRRLKFAASTLVSKLGQAPARVPTRHVKNVRHGGRLGVVPSSSAA